MHLRAWITSQHHGSRQRSSHGTATSPCLSTHAPSSPTSTTMHKLLIPNKTLLQPTAEDNDNAPSTRQLQFHASLIPSQLGSSPSPLDQRRWSTQPHMYSSLRLYPRPLGLSAFRQCATECHSRWSEIEPDRCTNVAKSPISWMLAAAPLLIQGKKWNSQIPYARQWHNLCVEREREGRCDGDVRIIEKVYHHATRANLHAPCCGFGKWEVYYC